MAISNLPYDDAAIVAGLKKMSVQSEEVSHVSVNFTSNDVGPDTTATVTATLSWIISSADAVRLLDAARPEATSSPSPGLVTESRPPSETSLPSHPGSPGDPAPHDHHGGAY